MSEVKQEGVDIEMNFKDIKSIDDLNFDNLENLVRGKTPDDIQEKCLNLCKDYLSGNWREQSIDTIEVRRITGGLMNQIYYCGIRQPNNSEGVPQEVAIRLYGDNFDSMTINDAGRIRDMVISLTFSEKQLGPKLYGLFEEGQIQKFYKHRVFKGEDQSNPELIKKVYQTLAQIHSMHLPLKKNYSVIEEVVEKSIKEASEIYPIKKLAEEYNCKTLMKYDLMTEFNWIKGLIERVNSPVMFTHNDYRSSNLMITEPNDELVVCDYDLSSYGHRGNDFVALLREWGRKQFDLKSIEGIPLGSEFKPMIEIYVEECERIYGKSYSQNPNNSVDHILKEAKVFLMYSYLFFTVMPLRKKKDVPKDGTPNHKFMMDFAEMSFKHYMDIKNILGEQNIFN